MTAQRPTRPLWILTDREFRARVTKKGYWIFTLFGLVVMVALTFLPVILNSLNQVTRTHVVLVDNGRLISVPRSNSEASQQGISGLNITVVNEDLAQLWDKAAIQAFLKAHQTKVAVVVQGPNTAQATFAVEENGNVSPSTQTALQTWLSGQVIGARTKSLPGSAQRILQTPVPFVTHQWQTGALSSERLMRSQILVYFMELLLFVTIMVYGAWVAQGVVEEKSNRIVEMMLVTVRPAEILFGKVLGIGLVALIQYAIWIVAVVVSMVAQHNLSKLPVSGLAVSTLLVFPVFFVLGYLFYGTLFGIAGSLVHRAEEQQMAIAPVTLLSALVFYSGMFALPNPDSTFAKVISFIPPFAPLTMFMRVALGQVPPWQVGVALALLVLSIWLLLRAGAAIYRRFALHNSGPAGWRLLLRRSTNEKQRG